MLQQTASDARTPCRFVDGHLADFKFSWSDGDQCAAAHRLTIQNGQEDTSAVIEYRFLRMCKCVLVFWFESKMACDPCLIKTLESNLISLLEVAKNEFGMLRIHWITSAAFMSSLPPCVAAML